jgi:AraC-like DNA-binding protein/mannose-6-phosphate isomerase-like protein (cupin superfamily)
MGIIKRKETAEFDLDNDYFIHRVDLKRAEEEHTHKFIELVYTLSGRGVHRVDGREYHVKGGDMLIVNYHCRHAVTPIENLSYIDIMLKPEYVNDTLKGTEDIFLLLNLRDFSDLSNSVIRDNLLISFDGDDRQRIEFLLGWTREEQKNVAPAGELIIYSALSMLLSLVFRKMTENRSLRPALNDQLLSYMERNCANRLLIREMADACGYTPEHFSRIFKAYVGRSPVAYLGECRIKRAKELLSSTDRSVEEIIEECGFSNRTAFFKKFADSTGLSPLQYRKNQK